MPATIGSQIKVLMNGAEKVFKIVEPCNIDPLNGCISYESPIAQSVSQAQIGSTIDVALPNGRTIGVTVLDIA